MFLLHSQSLIDDPLLEVIGVFHQFGNNQFDRPMVVFSDDILETVDILFDEFGFKSSCLLNGLNFSSNFPFIFSYVHLNYEFLFFFNVLEKLPFVCLVNLRVYRMLVEACQNVVCCRLQSQQESIFGQRLFVKKLGLKKFFIILAMINVRGLI